MVDRAGADANETTGGRAKQLGVWLNPAARWHVTGSRQLTHTADWLSFINLFFAGIAAGSLLFELLVVVPAMDPDRYGLDRSALMHYMLLGKGNLPARCLPPASALAGISGIALLLSASHQTRTFEVLYLVGVVSMVTMGISTVTQSHPINRKIARCPVESFESPESVPPQYAKMRRFWDRVMLPRTLLGAGAFACFILGTIAG